MAKKSKKEIDLKEKIKEMENSKREVLPTIQVDKKITFDSWYHQRKNKIPKQHMKEILLADFKSRGLDEESTMEMYDKALKIYGVRL